MPVMMLDDETAARGIPCPFCDALIPADEHWSNCPAAPDTMTADDDPDSDKGF